MRRIYEIASVLEGVFKTSFNQEGLFFHRVIIDGNGNALMMITLEYSEEYDFWESVERSQKTGFWTDVYRDVLDWRIYPMTEEGELIFFADHHITVDFMNKTAPFEKLLLKPVIFRKPDGGDPHLAFAGSYTFDLKQWNRPLLEVCLDKLLTYAAEVMQMLPVYRAFCSTLTWPDNTTEFMEAMHSVSSDQWM